MKEYRIRLRADGSWVVYRNNVVWGAGRWWTHASATLLSLQMRRGLFGFNLIGEPGTKHPIMGQLPLLLPKPTELDVEAVKAIEGHDPALRDVISLHEAPTRPGMSSYSEATVLKLVRAI